MIAEAISRLLDAGDGEQIREALGGLDELLEASDRVEAHPPVPESAISSHPWARS